MRSQEIGHTNESGGVAVNDDIETELRNRSRGTETGSGDQAIRRQEDTATQPKLVVAELGLSQQPLLALVKESILSLSRA